MPNAIAALLPMTPEASGPVIMALSLIAPAVCTLAVILVSRKLLGACWRGYWDVV